jgi:hypothetical protein
MQSLVGPCTALFSNYKQNTLRISGSPRSNQGRFEANSGLRCSTADRDVASESDICKSGDSVEFGRNVPLSGTAQRSSSNLSGESSAARVQRLRVVYPSAHCWPPSFFVCKLALNPTLRREAPRNHYKPRTHDTLMYPSRGYFEPRTTDYERMKLNSFRYVYSSPESAWRGFDPHLCSYSSHRGVTSP